MQRIVFVMLPCKEQQAAAYKGSRKIEFCPDRQKCPRQIYTDLTALVCATAHQNQVWEGHSASCRDQCHKVELCGSVFFRGQNGDLHGMGLLLTMVEDGLEIQAVAPILVKISVQHSGVGGVAVQHQLCPQRRAADGLAVLYCNAGGIHFKGDLIPGLLTDPAVFPVVQMPQLFLRVCPETLQLGRNLPDGQPPGILISVGGERCREGRLLLRFFPVGVDCLQQLDDGFLHPLGRARNHWGAAHRG